MAERDRTIDIFLASPGDVDEEREAARRVVDDLAVTYRSSGWTVRIWGWEQARPGLGRAQDRINPEVDRCDLLVGVLGRNWGTPTGDFTSGFEEEFERVRGRREAGDEVEAMIFVRKLESGEHAEQANLEFRERLREIALYKPYAGTGDFELVFQRALTSYVVDRVAAEAVERSVPELQAEEPAAEAATAEEPNGGGLAAGVPQTQLALRAVSRAVAGQAEGLQQLDLVRAHLATAAELSSRLTRATLDVQDLMAAYRHRSEIEVTAGERVLIDRTLALIGYTAAGWGLTGSDDWARRFGALIFNEPDPDVKVGALRELGSEGLRALAASISEGSDVEVVSVYVRLLEDDDERMREKGADYLADARVDGAVVALRSLFERTGSIAAFNDAMTLLLGADPESAAKLAFEHPAWAEDFEDRLAELAPLISEETIRAAYSERPAVKRLALRLLAERGELTEDEARLEIQAENRALRLQALRALIEMGGEIDEAEVEELSRETDVLRSILDNEGPSVRRLWLESRANDDLRDRATYGRLGLAGPDALITLLARDEDDELLEQVRAGLQEGLDALRVIGMDAAIERFGDDPEVRVWLATDFEESQNLYDQVWLAASLRGLAARGPEPIDADLARRHIGSGMLSVREAAAELLGLAATAEDVPLLVQFAGDSHGDTAGHALTAAARVVDRGENLLDAIADGEPPRGLRSGVLNAIFEGSLPVELDRLRHLLHERDPDVRRAALALATRDLPRDDLAELLAAYSTEEGSRFYHVIGVLDRLIYAPAEIAHGARRWIEPTSAP